MSVSRVGVLVQNTTLFVKKFFPKMVDYFKESYFHQLPHEILVSLLCYVNTFDLTNFCEAYDYECFFSERKIMKTVNLGRQYALRDLKRVSKKMTFEYVTTLNINFLYWIPVADLRKFIKKMTNLRNLFAIDTELDLAPENIAIYNDIKIKKLAVTLNSSNVGPEKLTSIEALYINVLRPALFVRALFPALTQVWVDLRQEPFNSYDHYVWSSSKITKIFYKVEYRMLENYTHLGLLRYFHSGRSRQPSVECWEKFSSYELRNQNATQTHIPAWQTLMELHAQYPCGVKNFRELYLNQATLTNINFDELNFNHGRGCCTPRYYQAAKEILVLPNSRFLKKLCLSSCFLQCQYCENLRKLPTESQGFKRKRIGLLNGDCVHKNRHFLGNFSALEVLEIFPCDQTPHTTALQVLPIIGDLKMLKSLTVELPPFINGHFLIKVLSNCKNLEVLKVTSLRENEHLNYNICKAIQLGSSLKDFRYGNSHIPMDRLIEAVCEIDNPKLERIMLICDNVNKFSAKPLKTMLELNSRLIFLYIVIHLTTQKAIKMAKETLKFYKKQHPAKLFFIENGNVFVNGGYPIPDVHYQEMVRFESRVSVPIASEDFESF